MPGAESETSRRPSTGRTSREQTVLAAGQILRARGTSSRLHAGTAGRTPPRKQRGPVYQPAACRAEVRIRNQRETNTRAETQKPW